MNFLLPLIAATLLIRVGQGMYASGISRSKNAVSAIIRSICELFVSVIAFWAIGAALMFAAPQLLIGWSGTPDDVFFAINVVLIGVGGISSTTGERSTLPVVFVSAAALAGLTIPLAARLAWFGWLPRFTDVAGAAVIYIPVGAAALAGAIVIGPRIGKYNRDGSTTFIPAHNVPLAITGVLTVLAGFVLYVMAMSGWRLSHHGASQGLTPQAGMNALVCISAAGASAILFSRHRYGKIDVGVTLLGAWGGAVAITAAGGSIGSPAAFLTGAVAGAIVPFVSIKLDLRTHIDDPAGAASIHLVGGLWGTLSAGLFLPGSVGNHFVHLGAQLFGALVITTLSTVISFAALVALKKTVGVRAREADEIDGLDLAEHDVGAYPDFQQNTIKSYHLREA